MISQPDILLIVFIQSNASLTATPVFSQRSAVIAHNPELSEPYPKVFLQVRKIPVGCRRPTDKNIVIRRLGAMRQNVFRCRSQASSDAVPNDRVPDAFGYRQTVSRACCFTGVGGRTGRCLENQARRGPLPVFCRNSEKLTAGFQALKH